jgi:hypothetical protein
MSLVTVLVHMHTVITNSVRKELVGSRSSLFVLSFALFIIRYSRYFVVCYIRGLFRETLVSGTSLII